jgi:hypothetical protein
VRLPRPRTCDIGLQCLMSEDAEHVRSGGFKHTPRSGQAGAQYHQVLSILRSSLPSLCNEYFTRHTRSSSRTRHSAALMSARSISMQSWSSPPAFLTFRTYHLWLSRRNNNTGIHIATFIHHWDTAQISAVTIVRHPAALKTPRRPEAGRAFKANSD